MKESLELKETFSANPSKIYEAWLDSTLHTKMTGGLAVCSKNIGDSFTTWDGYIEGKNIELKLNEKIIQSWRTSEFDKNDEDSRLIIRLNALQNGTEFIIEHSNIPEGQTQYKQGWKDHYFTPMKSYFERKK